MEHLYQYGYPNTKRELIIAEGIEKAGNGEKFQVEYRGKYRALPVIEVPIELPVYRIENIRTKSLQKQWLAQHSDEPKDLFTSDPASIAAQQAQHQVLRLLVDKANLMKEFKDDKHQQLEPLIVSKSGVMVNGNRRLCAWRELYYTNNQKYAHFQTIRVAVLPDSDEQGIYDLEVALQIRPDMKAEYSWHAIAADYQEKFDAGVDLSKLAKKQNKKLEEINTYIECYNYAAEYLESIGHSNEWQRVDKQEYAFKQIVVGRKTIQNPGDKELFREVSNSMLRSPAVGERLYKQIPRVVNCLPTIAKKLEDAFEITIENENQEELDLLMDGDSEKQIEASAQIANAIRLADDPNKVVQIVNNVLEANQEIENEKKKKSFVFDQVMKAATCLTNAVKNLDDAMSKEGVGKQIENIEGACTLLKDWIK